MCKTDNNLSINQKVVYPAHGLGTITGIEHIETLGQKMFVIDFEEESLKLKIPVSRATKVGLRPLATKEEIDLVLKTLRTTEQIVRSAIWNRRAQEYESKICSGKLIYIAEVVRDLSCNVTNPDRSYSERVIFETAFARLNQEIAFVKNMSLKETESMINSVLQIETLENKPLSDEDSLEKDGNGDNIMVA